MNFRRWRWLTGMAALLTAFSGCRETMRPLNYIGDAQLGFYEDKASKISYPLVEEETPDQVRFSDPPRTLSDPRKDEKWELSLVEAIHTAVSNNTIIRSRNRRLVNTENNTPSAYDQAIQETGVLFGGRGVEAALAAFDATFSTAMTWGRDKRVSNIGNPITGVYGPETAAETGDFSAQISKPFANGSSLAVAQNWSYLGSNQQNLLFPSSYTGSLGASFRQPLWSASGVEFTRIAGPVNPTFSAITGVSQGVVIARINNDITIADFEASVRDLLRDVEQTYWDLYLAYRSFDAAVAARNSAQESWRVAEVTMAGGGKQGFRNADEAQARDQYFESRVAVQDGLNEIYRLETELRRLMGVAANDGRIIRPITEPTMAEIKPDWYLSLTETLTRRVELRKQKWNIKSLELQLKAAESLTNPRLDFVSGYRVYGFGDDLFGSNDNDGLTEHGFASAYETLSQGDQTGWNLGFEFSMPVGFRQAIAQRRNIELRLAKARDVLAALEMELAHDLSDAFQNLTLQHVNSQANFNRRRAALDRARLFGSEWKAGTATLDEWLRAQRSQANAEIAFYRSVVEYNKALLNLHYTKGTLLEFNNVTLAEGAWTPEAYEEALRRAWARSHGIHADKVHQEPSLFVSDGFVGTIEVDPFKTLSDSDLPQQPADATRAYEQDTKIPPAPAEETETVEPAATSDEGTEPPVAPLDPAKESEKAPEIPPMPTGEPAVPATSGPPTPPESDLPVIDKELPEVPPRPDSKSP